MRNSESGLRIEADLVRPERSSTAGGETGFSLIELIVVVVLLGIAVSVSIPALTRGSTALRLRASGRDVLNLLRYAREKAITLQVGMLVTVERDARKLVLTDAYGEGPRTLRLSDDVKIERILARGQEVTDGSIIIRFVANGSCDKAEIVLKSKNGGTLRVETDPITGGARIITQAETRNP